MSRAPLPFAHVVLPLPLEGFFTYRVPECLAAAVVPGSAVVVPFGRRRLTGVVLSRSSESPVEAKEILALAPVPPIPPVLLALARWTSSYYLQPLGAFLRLLLPPSRGEGMRLVLSESGRRALKSPEPSPFLAAFRRGPRTAEALEKAFSPETVARALAEGLIEVAPPRRVEREAPPPGYRREEGAVERLTSHQEEAVGSLFSALDGGFSAHLLMGVTGSGKTEVYLRAAVEALRRGLGVLFLVPEIALTPLLVSRLARTAPGEVAVLHSGLSDAGRASAWRTVQEGRARLVVGVRSAVFAPVPRLGLIIVDEEHDPSFRQEETPGYSARDVAVKRAQLEDVPVVLGSATPSLESFHNAEAGRYRLLTLPGRVTPAPEPEVEVVDLARPAEGTSPHPFLSPRLIALLGETLTRKEQAILFLNRRGFAPFLLCRDCSFTLPCPNCSVTLTYHRRKGMLCHYCGHAQKPPSLCPSCGGTQIEPVGAGTQRVEEALASLFPRAAVARLDRDAAGKRGALEDIYRGVDAGRIDILVGTQMLAKGHDFPLVTLVGILAADFALDFPDFRSAERTFSLVTQVAGRSGRGEKRGKVLVQTYHPDHYAIALALAKDYRAFYRREMEVREAHAYPPFARAGRVVVEGRREEAVAKAAAALADRARRSGIRLLGPSPAPVSRILNRHRWHFLVLARDHRALASALSPLRDQAPSSLRVHLQVDPVNFM